MGKQKSKSTKKATSQSPRGISEELFLEEFLPLLQSKFATLLSFSCVLSEIVDQANAKALKFPSGMKEAHQLWQDFPSDDDVETKRAFVQKMIAICPGDVESYLILASYENNPAKVSAIYDEAVKAGAWMLESYYPDFAYSPMLWIYIGIRMEMADCLWSLGKRVESIEHLQAILPLCVDSKEDILDRLMFRLLEMDWEEELNELLEAYSERILPLSLAILFVLRSFKSGEYIVQAEEELRSIFEFAPEIYHLWVGEQAISSSPTERGSDSDFDPIHMLGILTLPIVRSVPGMSRWIREVYASSSLVAPSSSSTRTHRSMNKEIESLPQSDEIWDLGFRKIENSWIVILINREGPRPIHAARFERRPSNAEIWSVVAEGMLEGYGQTARPAKLSVPLESLGKSWKKRLSSMQIEWSVEDDAIDETMYKEVNSVMRRANTTIDPNTQNIALAESMPISDANWILSIDLAPIWVFDGPVPNRVAMITIFDEASKAIIGNEMCEAIDVAKIQSTILRSILDPMVGPKSMRPKSIALNIGDLQEAIEPLVEQLGIEVVECTDEHLDIIDDFLEMTVRHMSDGKALLDREGVTADQVHVFFMLLQNSGSLGCGGPFPEIGPSRSNAICLNTPGMP